MSNINYQILSTFLDDLGAQLQSSGIRSIINWGWLMLKTSHNQLAYTKSFAHYENYNILTDISKLRLIKRNIELAMRLLPVRTSHFYNL